MVDEGKLMWGQHQNHNCKMKKPLFLIHETTWLKIKYGWTSFYGDMRKKCIWVLCNGVKSKCKCKLASVFFPPSFCNIPWTLPWQTNNKNNNIIPYSSKLRIIMGHTPLI
jgi:hypothetical protein